MIQTDARRRSSAARKDGKQKLKMRMSFSGMMVAKIVKVRMAWQEKNHNLYHFFFLVWNPPKIGHKRRLFSAMDARPLTFFLRLSKKVEPRWQITLLRFKLQFGPIQQSSASLAMLYNETSRVMKRRPLAKRRSSYLLLATGMYHVVFGLSMISSKQSGAQMWFLSEKPLHGLVCIYFFFTQL